MNICKIVKLSGQIMQEHNCLKNNITRQYFWTFLNADFVFGWVTHIRYNLGCCQTDLNLAIIFQSPRSLSFSFYSKPMTTPYKLISPDMMICFICLQQCNDWLSPELKSRHSFISLTWFRFPNQNALFVFFVFCLNNSR